MRPDFPQAIGRLLPLLAIYLVSCASVPGVGDFSGAEADSQLLSDVRRITRENGLAVAREHLIRELPRLDGSHGKLEARVERTTADPALVLPDSLAAMSATRRARTAIVIVPGTKAANPNGRDRTRECLRGASERSREMGFSTWFIETEARGTVEENVRLVSAQVREAFETNDAVILVMLSKGAHDVVRYLQEAAEDLSPELRGKLVVVLSLAGTVQGSVVADWMAHSAQPFASMTRRWLKVSDQDDAVVMLESVARSPWEPEAGRQMARRFPNLTWIIIAMVPDGEHGRITERLWAPFVRRRIEKTAPYYSPVDGLVESAASLLPDYVDLPEWVVTGLGSHAMPNGAYRNGTRIAPQTTRPGREKLRPESGGEIMSAYLRALPVDLL